jgi:hypothetical protein
MAGIKQMAVKEEATMERAIRWSASEPQEHETDQASLESRVQAVGVINHGPILC